MSKIVRNISEVLGLSSTTIVRLLLNHFRWDQNVLTGRQRSFHLIQCMYRSFNNLERFWDDPDRLFQQCKIPNPTSSPSADYNPLSPQPTDVQKSSTKTKGPQLVTCRTWDHFSSVYYRSILVVLSVAVMQTSLHMSSTHYPVATNTVWHVGSSIWNPVSIRIALDTASLVHPDVIKSSTMSKSADFWARIHDWNSDTSTAWLIHMLSPIRSLTGVLANPATPLLSYDHPCQITLTRSLVIHVLASFVSIVWNNGMIRSNAHCWSNGRRKIETNRWPANGC